MVGILTRFAERAVIGAYLIMINGMVLYVVTISGLNMQPYLSLLMIDNLPAHVSEPWATWLTALASAAAVLSIVVLGFIVEIVRSVLGFEHGTFRWHLRNNSSWMRDFMEHSLPYYKDEFEVIVNHERIRFAIQRLKALKVPGIEIWRIHTALAVAIIVYVTSKQQDKITNLLSERMQSANMMSSVSTVHFISSLVPVAIMIVIDADMSLALGLGAMILFLNATGLFFTIMSSRAYSMFWYTAFAAVYIAYKESSIRGNEA